MYLFVLFMCTTMPADLDADKKTSSAIIIAQTICGRWEGVVLRGWGMPSKFVWQTGGLLELLPPPGKRELPTIYATCSIKTYGDGLADIILWDTYVHRGIYRVSGERMWICFNENAPDIRPTSLHDLHAALWMLYPIHAGKER